MRFSFFFFFFLVSFQSDVKEIFQSMAGIHMQWLLKVTAQTNVPFQVKLRIRLYSGLFKYKIPTKIQ